jgi:hypothetical protein
LKVKSGLQIKKQFPKQTQFTILFYPLAALRGAAAAVWAIALTAVPMSVKVCLYR